MTIVQNVTNAEQMVAKLTPVPCHAVIQTMHLASPMMVRSCMNYSIEENYTAYANNNQKLQSISNSSEKDGY